MDYPTTFGGEDVKMVAPPVSGRLDSNRVRLVDLEDCEVLMESGFTRMLALSCVDGEITDTPAQCDESETFAVHVSIGVGQEELFTITHLPGSGSVSFSTGGGSRLKIMYFKTEKRFGCACFCLFAKSLKAL